MRPPASASARPTVTPSNSWAAVKAWSSTRRLHVSAIRACAVPSLTLCAPLPAKPQLRNRRHCHNRRIAFLRSAVVTRAVGTGLSLTPCAKLETTRRFSRHAESTRGPGWHANPTFSRANPFPRSSGQGVRPHLRRDSRPVFPRGPQGGHRPWASAPPAKPLRPPTVS